MQPTAQNNFREIHTVAAIACVVLLAFHYYYFCYQGFVAWKCTYPLVDRFVLGLARSGLFRHRAISKLLAQIALAATTVGNQNSIQVKPQRLLFTLAAGVLLYFGSDLVFRLDDDPGTLTITYIIVSLSGLLVSHNGIRGLISLITWPYKTDIFNRYSESFPQEERLLPNAQSIHLQGKYTFRNRERKSVINLVDVYRGTLVMGIAGSGKTRYVFRSLIQQSIAHGMPLFVYDLKYDDLTRLTYNSFQRDKHCYTIPPTFYSVNFDDFSRSHRCNPLDPESLDDISDAGESARTILLGLNKRMIQLQGDFFVESAIGFFTANIWFLRKYEDGRYCTLAHLIELIQTDFYKLFSILRSVPEVETPIQSFVSALNNKSMEQLQGQVDSARIALAVLASPYLYYLLSANDFTLDLNHPTAPKIICIGSNPQKQNVYGAVISLYVSRMLKLVNRKGGIPCHLFFDEFPSFTALGMHLTLAQARANKVAVTFGIQDLAQLRMTYGRDHADALFNLPGNLICGQVSGDSARLVSERFGKILQDKSTLSINSRDSSSSQSQQLDLALPPSKIATLSSGEFVGITADSPSQPIQLKAFHARIVIDHETIEKEEAAWEPIPIVRTVTPDVVDLNFRQIKEEVRKIIADRLAYMQQDPELSRLIVTKGLGGHHPNP